MVSKTAPVSIDVELIKKDDAIYPRKEPSTAVIAQYVEALQSGKYLPPIEVQEGTNSLLDGYHRLRAHKECGLEQIEVIYVDLEDTPPLLYSAMTNSSHGWAISLSEKCEVACRTVEAFPDISNEKIAEFLSCKPHTVGNWVAHLRVAQQEARDIAIVHLRMLGWTQEEIGERVGLTKQAVSIILSQEDAVSAFTLQVEGLSTQGHPIDEIVKRTGLPERLVLALLLKDKTDQERAKELKIGIQPYSVWNFSSCDSRFGSEYPGRIPGQLIAHALYFYTQQGELVLDPMSGSGTTQDVCLAMGRRCYAYDANDKIERYDVIRHNILEEGWPDRLSKADLIFWDPPYFSKKDDEYCDQSISRLDRQSYNEFFSDALALAYDGAKNKTRLCLLMSNWIDYEGDNHIFICDYANQIRLAGWTLIQEIQTPLATQTVTGSVVTNYRENKKLAKLDRSLLVAVKNG